MKDRTTTPLQRSDADYAIEHAEYLAKDTERLIEAVNAYYRAKETEVVGAIDRAEELLGEYMRAARVGVYEFRKRAERALSTLSETASNNGAVRGPRVADKGSVQYGDAPDQSARDRHDDKVSAAQVEVLAWRVMHGDGLTKDEKRFIFDKLMASVAPSADGTINAAPQPSIAGIDSGLSQESLGRGDVAAAAPTKSKGYGPDAPVQAPLEAPGRTGSGTPSTPQSAIERRDDPFFIPFDCHYDGNIDRCDKDCKQLGECKRRTAGHGGVQK